MKMVKRYLSRLIKGLCVLILMTGLVSCSSQQPATSPKDVIKLFIQKHIPTIDLSVADFYIKEEQAGVRALVNATILTKQKEGTLESLKKANYDFTKLQIDVIAEKEDYINDAPVNLVEVKASGFYTVSVDGNEKTLVEDEIFVLESVGSEWKLTDKIRPWK